MEQSTEFGFAPLLQSSQQGFSAGAAKTYSGRPVNIRTAAIKIIKAAGLKRIDCIKVLYDFI
ncbi:MAG: hypothetical protein HY035_03015 [Nitrospirae bacterium]|nr:hypothetical protein [Nitrospirota bacterium]